MKKKEISDFWRMGNRLYFFLGSIICFTFFCFLSGCESCNENMNNKRYWVPSLMSPGYLNPRSPAYIDPNHKEGTAEGMDPYMDCTIGPRSLQARGWGYDLPRDRTIQANQIHDSSQKNKTK